MNIFNQFNQTITTFSIHVTIGNILITATVATITLTLTVNGTVWKWLSLCFDFAKRKYAAVQLKKTVTAIRSDPNFAEYAGEPPKGKVKFEFQKELHATDIKENESIVIALDSAENNPQNVANTAIQYVSKAILTKSAVTLDEPIEKGLSFTLARKALISNKLVAPQKYFEQQLLPSVYKKDPGFEKVMESMRAIDKMGLLTRVLLQQFYEVNSAHIDTLEYSKIKLETSRFHQFVHRLATREEWDYSTPLKFDGEFIRARVYLVTSSQTSRSGGSGLLERINNQSAYDFIYLICPAINRSMIDRNVPAWQVYNEVVGYIRSGQSRFALLKESDKFRVKGKNNWDVKVAVAFLGRNV